MTRNLLIIFIGGAIVSLVAFAALDKVGGFNWNRGDDHQGPQVTRDLPWTGTEALRIDNSSAEITYTQGPVAKLTVTGPAEWVNALTVNGDTVTGGSHWGFSGRHHHDRVQMTITSPNTHAFYLGGAEVLKVLNYDQDNLEVHLSGAGSVKATGKAKHAVIDMSGAGSLDMSELPVDDITINISGAGSAKADPRVSADVSISGAAHVSLLHNVALHKSISGFGDVSMPRTTTVTVGDSDEDDAAGSKAPKNDKDGD